MKRIGETADGLGIYRFRFKGDPMVRVGLMAQEVEQIKPHAVREFGGVKYVNYELAL